MKFTGGIIVPDKPLTPREVDELVEETVNKRARGLTQKDPCKIIEPFNQDVAAARDLLGNQFWDIMTDFWLKAVGEVGMSVGSAMIHNVFSAVGHVAGGQVNDLGRDAMTAASVGVGNFYSVFDKLLEASLDYQNAKGKIQQNQRLIDRASAAQLWLNEFYADLYDAMKKKMKDMKWRMKMSSFDKNIVMGRLMGVPVPVEYTASLDMSKWVVSEKFTGLYAGTITVTMEMKSGAPYGSAFDSAFPKSASPIKETTNRWYHRVPQGRNVQYQLTPNQPTAFKQVVRLKGDVTIKEAGQCVVDAAPDPEKPQFTFDYSMKSVSVTNFGGGGSYLSDSFALSSSDGETVDVNVSGDGRQDYYHIAPCTPFNCVPNPIVDDPFFKGWSGETVNMGGNDFLEPLKHSNYVIVKAQSTADASKEGGK